MPLKKPLFNTLNPVSKLSGHHSDSSIPAPSTSIGASKGPFFLNTVKPLSSMAVERVKVFDAGGDISKQWYLLFYCIDPLDGKRKRVRVLEHINKAKTVTERREVAESFRIIYQNYLDNGWNFFDKDKEVISKINTNILNCIETYLDDKKGNTARKTFNKYRQILGNSLTAYLKARNLHYSDISAIDKRVLLDFLADQKKVKGWNSNKTYNNYLLDLSTFFNYFINNYDHVLSKNPLKGVTRLREQLKGHTAYSDQQVADLKAFLEKDNPFLLLFCQTVYETCTRPQTEARHLKCGMFDFQRGVLRITSDIAKNSTTDYVPLRKEFMDKLKAYGVDKADPNDYLFTRYRKIGKHPINEQSLQLWYTKAKLALNLGQDFSIYSWKHTRNIHVWLDTKDVMFIKTLNRHKTLEMTMKYLRDLGCFVDNNELLEKTRAF